MPSEVKLLHDGDEDESWAAPEDDEILDEEDEEYADGSPAYIMVQKDNHLIFQRTDERTQNVDVSGEDRNLKQTPAIKPPQTVSQSYSVSERSLEYLHSGRCR